MISIDPDVHVSDRSQAYQDLGSTLVPSTSSPQMHASPPTTSFFWSAVPEEMDKIDRLEETNTNMEMETIKCNVHTQTDYKRTYIQRQTINTHTHTDRL